MDNESMKGATYAVTRIYPDAGFSEVIAEGLTLEEAQRHCHDPQTSSSTATGDDAEARTAKHGPWFDGYEVE